jgi:small GTP-binding protein
MSEKKRIKVVLLGESGVGKTNLIRVAVGEPFQKESDSTLSSSYYESEIIIKNKQYIYALWDTAGQEQYRALNKMFLKGAKIVIIVFSIDNVQSFEQVDFWVNHTKEALGEGKYLIALVANKNDLVDQQVVQDDDIAKKAKELNVKFKLTSAAEDAVGFRQFLEVLLKDFVNKIGFEEEGEKTFELKDEEKEEENVDDKDNKTKKKKKKKCC